MKSKLILLKKMLVLPLALNNAINLVETKWIARADSDDINMPNRFEKQIESAQDDYDVIGSNILEIDRTNKYPILEKKCHLKIVI